MTSSVKVIAIAVAAVVIILGAYEVYALRSGPGDVTAQVPKTFTVNGKTYNFTFTATTQAERETGLMNRKVTNTTTMLFAFPSFDKWSFWMYDTNTSLDIIWVNATGNSGRVVYLVVSAQPCYQSSTCRVYPPSSAANFVIEAKAGFAASNDITVGSVIGFGQW